MVPTLPLELLLAIEFHIFYSGILFIVEAVEFRIIFAIFSALKLVVLLSVEALINVSPCCGCFGLCMSTTILTYPILNSNLRGDFCALEMVPVIAFVELYISTKLQFLQLKVFASLLCGVRNILKNVNR